jgi:hypothetical protein
VVPVTLTETAQDEFAATVPPESDTLPEDAAAVAVPPQVFVSPGVAATVSPAGRLSVKATPVSAIEFELLIVIVSEVLPFNVIDEAPNALLMLGGTGAAVTIRVAVPVLPVPPSLDVTLLVVLIRVPVAVAVTLSETAHDEFPARVPPDRDTLPEAATAVAVPPQVFVRAGVAATVSPEGRVSVNATPVSAVEFELLIVRVSEVLPFTAIDETPNALLMLGATGTGFTVKVAVPVLPVPPSVDVTLLVVLIFVPVVVAVTLSETAHDEFAAMVPPVRDTLPDEATAVAVPPHVLVRAGVDATVRPAGRVSVKASPVSATAFELAIVMVSDVLPPTVIVETPNALLILGAVTAVKIKSGPNHP